MVELRVNKPFVSETSIAGCHNYGVLGLWQNIDLRLAHDFAGREETAPKDLESQPIIGSMKLAGETISLRRFTSFVPTPDTEGEIGELPFLAGQGVGLIRDVKPVAQIIDGMMAEAASALLAFHG